MRVRVRAPKSTAESARYSLKNCVVEAKIIRESSSSSKRTKEETNEDDKNIVKSRNVAPGTHQLNRGNNTNDEALESEKSEDDGGGGGSDDGVNVTMSNRFSALL